jgi:hypothetical protein
MDTALFKFVTADIRIWIVIITIYVTFRESNATVVTTYFLVVKASLNLLLRKKTVSHCNYHLKECNPFKKE